MTCSQRTRLVARKLFRCILFSAAPFALEAFSAAHAASWCAQYFNGTTNCYFTSQAQCLSAVSGVGGHCSPDLSGGPVQQSRPSDRVKSAPKRETETQPSRRKSAPERETAEPPKPVAPAPQPVVEQPREPPPQQEQTQPSANSFGAARALILNGKYEDAIAVLLALGYDDHPDIAASIGFASAKLGRLDDAKHWYEKALTADPNHLLALGNYGLLRVQQGDVARARADLEKIKTLCGGDACREYRELAAAIAAGTR
jgi:hypothetical protein